VWYRLVDAVMTPVLGKSLDNQLATVISRYEPPPGEQFESWGGYLDKCRASLWAAFDQAGNALQASQGPNPDKWRYDATVERLNFAPVPLHSMRYTNRPSGIQEVITFTGHR
jgi:hypothetical protein